MSHDQQKETLPRAAFEKIRTLMYLRFGIFLSDSKKDLVVSRLAERLRKSGIHSYEDYIRFVMHDPAELSAMVDALTTNFTSLFREPEHFEFLEHAALPVLRMRKSIAIWSAGCATGEEPYTIACWLVGKLGSLRPGVHILATDISGRALAIAKRAVYPEATFQGLSGNWRRRFLLRGGGQSTGLYRFKREITNLVNFAYLNLNEPLHRAGMFDVIFCRNVMIYFDHATRNKLLERLSAQLKPAGHFLPGHAESLPPEIYGMRRVHPAVYQKREDAR